ncbi:MAG: hypothetical protein LBT89_01020 [Planctomycetaceae bacterium]|jgi:tetratricopeptide (TPR) repeat protein|nr:hypothetical protein [Planctomycetaceae bacterium]
MTPAAKFPMSPPPKDETYERLCDRYVASKRFDDAREHIQRMKETHNENEQETLHRRKTLYEFAQRYFESALQENPAD